MNKAARLTQMLHLLQIKGPITAADLATAFEVSQRTIYRDIKALCEWGIPIIAQPGPLSGGYSLDYDYSIPDLTPEEISFLGMGGSAIKPFNDLLDTSGIQGVLNNKMLASISSDRRPILERQLKYIMFDTSRWYKSYVHDETNLSLVKQAVVHNKILEINYKERNATIVRSTLVDAYGLVFKSNSWYLVGYSHLESITRRWNMTRMTGVKITSDPFERPTGFSLSDWWENELETFGKGNIRVLFAISKSAWPRFERFQWKKGNRFIEEDNQYIVEMIVDEYDWLVDLALINRGGVEILEPAELREKLSQIAWKIHQAHTGVKGTLPSSEEMIDFEIFSITHEDMF